MRAQAGTRATGSLGTILLLFASLLHGADSDFFERRVRPVFAEHCYQCHSAEAEKIKGGLRLDTVETVRKGGDSGALFVPGQPEKSLLIKAVRYTDPDLQMPPPKGGDRKLFDAQIAHLVEWVKMGAPLPAGSNQGSVAADSFAAARTNWAFRAPVDPAVPKVKNTASIKSPIDSFILAKLEAAGARPAESAHRPADKRTLIRRATYDLTGLPPTLEEVESFLKDTSRNAFAKVVDRLLASPRYGEKWARHWLDIVRYADSFDSRGIGGEADVPEAWRYRDWVVNAFNSDMPYDQFIIQQIAGDILATNVPGKFDTNALIATGVFVIGEWGTGDADKEKMLTDIVDDQIDVTGRGFLGLTLACARCHDHKFDPIPASDYYGLAGVFFSSHILPSPGAKTAGSPVLRIPLVPAEQIAARKTKEQRAAELEKEINSRTGAVFLTNAKRGQFNQPTLAELHPSDGTDLPNAIANSGDAPISFITITLPAHSVAIHPSPERSAAAVWQSPLAGEIEIKGRVLDADDKCGNGIEWTLFHGQRPIAAGKFDNGKDQTVAATNVTVQPGELIQLIVSPRGKDHSCDTTVVQLDVRERGGEQRAWKLPDDVAADLPARANTGAWHFLSYRGAPLATLTATNVSEAERLKLDNTRKELAALRAELERKIPVAHGLQEGGTPKSAYEGIRDSHILIRGKYDRLGEIVPRHFPRVLTGERTVSLGKEQSGRLELARWIASKENPLTARVMVNRIWQHHFGEGIVRTPNNFGKLGTPPTHPELLDWLAHRFVDSGWSLKAMHRLMMLSATYQQASVVESRRPGGESQKAARALNVRPSTFDPENLLFARMNRRRLEAEEIRDALLFVTSQLDFTRGGLAINDIKTKRRTLYLMTVRSDKSSYRSLFDAPDAQTIAEGRIDSTVAPQALFLLNNPFALAQTKALAERALKQEAKDDTGRIHWLYALLFAREPSAKELALGLRALAEKGEERFAAWERYCQVLLCANEFIYID